MLSIMIDTSTFKSYNYMRFMMVDIVLCLTMGQLEHAPNGFCKDLNQIGIFMLVSAVESVDLNSGNSDQSSGQTRWPICTTAIRTYQMTLF